MGLIFRVIPKFHEFFGKKVWLDLKIDPFVFCFHLQSALCRIAGRAAMQFKSPIFGEITTKIKYNWRKSRSGDVNKSVSLIFIDERNTFLLFPLFLRQVSKLFWFNDKPTAAVSLGLSRGLHTLRFSLRSVKRNGFWL